MDVNGLSELPVFLPIFTTIHSTITSSMVPAEIGGRVKQFGGRGSAMAVSFLRIGGTQMCYPAEIIMKNHCFSTHDR